MCNGTVSVAVSWGGGCYAMTKSTATLIALAAVLLTGCARDNSAQQNLVPADQPAIASQPSAPAGVTTAPGVRRIEPAPSQPVLRERETTSAARARAVDDDSPRYTTTTRS